MIDSLIINLRHDPGSTRQRCAEFMNACSSHGFGHSDKNFETAILGCTLDDQKRIKKRLQGLLDYIDKMHILEMTQWKHQEIIRQISLSQFFIQILNKSFGIVAVIAILGNTWEKRILLCATKFSIFFRG